MHPVASLIADNVVKHHQLFAPLLFSVLATASNVHTPVDHSLFVTAISWIIIWVALVLRVGIYSNSSRERRNASWSAGALLALSQICDRAACDKQGIWATKALLPCFVTMISQNDRLSKYMALPIHTILDSPTAETKLPLEQSSHSRSYSLLGALTISASAVLALYTTSTTFLLGLSSILFAAVGLVILESLTIGDIEGGRHDSITAHGASVRRLSISGTQNVQQMAVLRDVVFVVAVVCGTATYLMEPSVTSTSITWEPVYRLYDMDWRDVHNYRILQRILWMLPVHVLTNVSACIIIAQQGVVNTSLISLFAYLCAKLCFGAHPSSIWFTTIYGLTSLLLIARSTATAPLVDMRRSLRLKRLVIGITTLSLFALIFQQTRNTTQRYPTNVYSAILKSSPDTPLGAVPVDLSKGHPAAQLIKAAEADFQRTLDRQSKSLAAAVQEYRRRNGIAPPPHFDKWYEFATRNGVVMIDEFDTINQMLLPFWAVKPATLRSRVMNALGHEDSALIAIAVRHGAVENFEKGDEWQQQATIGMMKEFVQYLPDMDLGFNMHDEPRVVVPTNLLSAMIAKARDEVLPRTAKNRAPQNSFSARPADMNDGTRFAETSTTKFNRFAHQQTWTHSRLSCASDTQAQTFEDSAADNLTAYAAGPLNYVYNVTAFSDICNSPSLSSTFGFFERPNAFSITHELTPIFSQSKISSFQDILYPSPWYWAGKVGYDETHDTTWNNKTNSLYWRGSTTGGFSRNGGWRRQHRQHLVRRLNAPDKAQVLIPSDNKTPPTTYSVTDIDRHSLSHLIDVKFSHIGQCDPGDCAAQKEFFHITERVDGQDAWYHKHLLDMDGNAFSGRFYSFLKSKSLTYKMAVFREWHAEWLRPWVHYIPLSLQGDEGLDLVKYFAGGGANDEGGGKGGNGQSEGERKAMEIAERSTEWHDRVLRNVDFEVWLFRLLLEYGRVVDDKREEIGYPGP
ncbi:glycosyltransferase family 90 protein [Plenodomus tracheiphilus IPT5]|uniref:Glycosyltransferase family 90 protein n=1 Tax=Plenodomus tracheiphilus IPT5 TaxID=1408161 RepID=A0A6A7BFL1_9PLEO|nr:glycosyltransferase family 90 protein [Plenodomus tracheiphilus IPT5]